MMMDADDDDETMPNEGDSEGYWGRNHNKYDTEKRKKKKRKKKKRTIWNDGNEESKMPNQKKTTTKKHRCFAMRESTDIHCQVKAQEQLRSAAARASCTLGEWSGGTLDP